jgi:hypothetical protein
MSFGQAQREACALVDAHCMGFWHVKQDKVSALMCTAVRFA